MPLSSDTYKNVPPPILTIFGANGNLSQQKLLPSIYALLKSGYIPDDTLIICATRALMDKKTILQQLEIHLLRTDHECDAAILAKLGEMLVMVKVDLTKIDDYLALRHEIERLDAEAKLRRNRLFYFAVPPNVFHEVLSFMHDVGLHEESEGVASRILIEKPFGTDVSSAKEIIAFIEERFHEEQIYRIDHYLAKETAQNILVFRSQNPLIENIWGRQYIDHIQITAFETKGVDWRGNFYEKTGALRDIVQSHLLQIMSLVMMEVPLSITSDSIHEEKLALLNAVRSMKAHHVAELAVRGQYEGYCDDVGNSTSLIETYAAVKLDVDNSRWGGVPVLLRTGKGLKKKMTEVRVLFKDRSRRNVFPNILTIRIQPDEGISLELLAKQPGFTDKLQPVHMDFKYAAAFEGKHPEAYERVLLDAMIGDRSLFATSAEVLRSWEIVEPILRVWAESTETPVLYPRGSMGPKEADLLAEEFGNEWINNDPTAPLPLSV